MQSSLVHRSLRCLLVTVLAVWGMSAWGDCACFCVDGEQRTLCTEVGEAQDGANLCANNGGAACPQTFDSSTADTYDAPEGAQNCRDVQVYDAIRGEYVSAKACNVL